MARFNEGCCRFRCVRLHKQFQSFEKTKLQGIFASKHKKVSSCTPWGFYCNLLPWYNCVFSEETTISSESVTFTTVKQCQKLKEWFQHTPLTLQLHPLGHLPCSDNCWWREARECINRKQALLHHLRKATFLHHSSAREAKLHTGKIHRWNSSILNHHHYLFIS